ncbi:MAG: carbohydrate kinase family protein [Anaerolineae bacterium]|nr:carbohydrate kinase family protein [Anaerolineae bacterium]
MKKVLVVGELNADLIMSGLLSLPVLGQELLCDDFRTVMGGSSSICACWTAGLGAHTAMWSKVGADGLGEFLTGELARMGVITEGVIRNPDIRTGATISLTYPHDRAMMTYLGAIANLSLDDLDLDQLKNYNHLHSASIFLQHKLRPGLPALFKAAQEAGLSTSLDSGWDPTETWGKDIFKVLPYVDYFFPNEAEALHFTGQVDVEKSSAILSGYTKNVIVKLGAQGALARSGELVWRMPGFAVTPVDTTGAGDAFNAGFIYARVIEEQSIPDAVRFGNACGAIAVTTIGGTGGIPPAAQVHTFLLKRAHMV